MRTVVDAHGLVAMRPRCQLADMTSELQQHLPNQQAGVNVPADMPCTG